jgi:hypothetical protein
VVEQHELTVLLAHLVLVQRTFPINTFVLVSKTDGE